MTKQPISNEIIVPKRFEEQYLKNKKKAEAIHKLVNEGKLKSTLIE